ncbi:MAG: exopolysaccharide biosynthesis polyprenyl glycosylphosphotransferase [Deltaproteobacteria bacterium]|nr:exopolysaccharide biosynthesis polyprenyl glycosylphosphotransferase [Deltaproteobacteria bacterium]
MEAEAESFHITNPVPASHTETPTPSRTGSRGVAPSSGERRRTPVNVRMGLQRRAQVNLRRHLYRAVRRFAILLIADLASFYVMRALLRAIRDESVLGTVIATPFVEILPKGILNGWQFAVALLVGLFVTGNYGPGDQRKDAKRLFYACALATSLPLWATIWTRGMEVVALQYSLTTVLVWLGLLSQRLLLDRVIELVAPRRNTALRTLFVGPAEDCAEAVRGPAFTNGSEHQVLGFLDVHVPPSTAALGHIVDFAAVLHESGAETVVVCGYLSDGRFHDVVDAALTAGCQVFSVPRAIELAGVQPTVIWRHHQPLVELSAPTLRGGQLFVKRFVDIVASTLGLVLISPLLAVIALAVKLDSRGSVLFRQERVGRGGRRFRIIKFRTMVPGAEEQREGLMAQSIYPDRRLFKLHSDPRVTPLGRWLRRTSLDELPQLFNVLQGAMSLVGPRPPLPSEVALYEQHHYARFDVKPGITGPWQVAGRNEITDFEQIVLLETDYIRNWSLLRDVTILLKTIPVVVWMRGAV